MAKSLDRNLAAHPAAKPDYDELMFIFWYRGLMQRRYDLLQTPFCQQHFRGKLLFTFRLRSTRLVSE